MATRYYFADLMRDAIPDYEADVHFRYDFQAERLEKYREGQDLEPWVRARWAECPPYVEDDIRVRLQAENAQITLPVQGAIEIGQVGTEANLRVDANVGPCTNIIAYGGEDQGTYALLHLVPEVFEDANFLNRIAQRMGEGHSATPHIDFRWDLATAYTRNVPAGDLEQLQAAFGNQEEEQIQWVTAPEGGWPAQQVWDVETHDVQQVDGAAGDHRGDAAAGGEGGGEAGAADGNDHGDAAAGGEGAGVGIGE